MQEQLTPAQLRVLKLVVTGASNAEIAQQLRLSIKTIETHVAEMLARTGAKNRTELTFMTLTGGLLNGVE